MRRKCKNFQIHLIAVKYSGTYEKSLIYLNSIVNYGIWKLRNDIRFKSETFNAKVLMRKLVRTIGARKRLNPNLAPSFQIPHIDRLYESMTVTVKSFPFDNG